jgi:hypothetical protein
VSWNGGDWTGTVPERMTTNRYEARAIPDGSIATMSVSLNVVTTSEISPSVTVGGVSPKFVPVM